MTQHMTELERKAMAAAGREPSAGPIDLTNTSVAAKLRAHTTSIDNLSEAEKRELRQEVARQQQDWDEAVAKAPPPGVAHVPGMAEAFNAPQVAAIKPAEDKTGAEIKTPAGAICARCGHPHGAPLVDATDDDKRDYLQVVLGAPRFIREYQLYNGLVTVRFQTLNPLEEEMAHHQTDHDLSTQSALGPAAYMRRLQEYLMCAAIVYCRIQDKRTLQQVPIKNMDYNATTHATPLFQLREHMMAEMFPSAALWRATFRKYGYFQALVHNMEANADSDDFFTGIELAV